MTHLITLAQVLQSLNNKFDDQKVVSCFDDQKCVSGTDHSRKNTSGNSDWEQVCWSLLVEIDRYPCSICLFIFEIIAGFRMSFPKMLS